ncbi:dTDP-4-dehydrorhamnose reductase [Marmoricola endophyticus]|uniref:dTDP-4-dehydrorhamnose reductase n=1 Tax=Marmoricola endophyticus TaxID=2040280 RepID=A0A917F621_9ACTN|nr:bifunctional dTDP-4-dehydrorhamnose 3,5-epimerase family protein/NAD(P)-dependent oxidoreductase [Marmoricola endophyticus]GGF51569.1 dTDP-4-dehydrorhamnose reductase [Marmoricola endophyticus]
MSALPAVHATAIPGLLRLELDLRGDARGFFKENWQRAKMVAGGLPDFAPVQQNISFNATRGVTRGMHAEPWDKLVSVATGRVYAAWVDLRPGESFGTVATQEIGPGDAVFVPRGVANGFQVLEDGTAYSYLVNDHWSPDAIYLEVDAADPALGIGWPVPLDDPAVEMSAKDRANPALADVAPFPGPHVLVIGRGQVGRAASLLLGGDSVDLPELNIGDPASVAAFDFSPYDVVVNAAAYTAVDAAETDRAAAWAVNATGPALLAAAAREHGFTLVHYSSDYVYDGTAEEHVETEPLAPLGVYGQSKAAGDLAVAAAPQHYLLRTSWVVGDGNNFVRTMLRLARDGVSPSVVDDQVGRLSFADELARATAHLLQARPACGTYHVTNGGQTRSWCDYARMVFAAAGRDAGDVTAVSTEEYAAGKVLSPRPAYSTLSLQRIRATGFEPVDADEALAAYVAAELA